MEFLGLSERNHVKVLGTVPIIWGAISSYKLLLTVLCKVLTIVKVLGAA